MPFDHLGMHRISELSSACHRATRCQSLLVIQTSDDDPSTNNLFTPNDAGESTPVTYSLTLRIMLSRDKIKVLAQFDNRVLSVTEVRRLLSRWESLIQTKDLPPGEIVDLNLSLTKATTLSAGQSESLPVIPQYCDAETY
jgi:hypothetical protein